MARIGIVGGGISGLSAAWYLQQLNQGHEVVLFESEGQVGGHTYTVPVEMTESGGKQNYKVDMGFIVFNDHTYPNFNQLLDDLEVGRNETSMGFAVSAEATGVEYCGNGIGGVFAQKRNWFSINHWRMVRDILRFNSTATELLDSAEGEMPLLDYLRAHNYSERFISHYILAMGGAIWSCNEEAIGRFPAKFFVRFFENHGLLKLKDRPQWFVVPGGSRTYVEALLERLTATIHTNAKIDSIKRVQQGSEKGVTISLAGQADQHFDEVILACHSDQSASLISDKTDVERACLDDLPYQDNEVVLHTDISLLPKRESVWSSWNAYLPKDTGLAAQVTYNMNILQGLESEHTFCVTLNNTNAINPETIIHQVNFAHPLFTPAGMKARETLLASNGENLTWFCGAWCGNGFHEDGVLSALNVVRALEKKYA